MTEAQVSAGSRRGSNIGGLASSGALLCRTGHDGGFAGCDVRQTIGGVRTNDAPSRIVCCVRRIARNIGLSRGSPRQT